LELLKIPINSTLTLFNFIALRTCSKQSDSDPIKFQFDSDPI
jgi:hypothetical protein